MNPKPANIKVSVVVPVFNTRNFLEKCLDSVLQQSHSNIEVIIVNDGSTDGSRELCLSYAQRDRRICYLEQEHSRLPAARMAGIGRATGEFITFVDSDDFVAHTLIESLVAPLSHGDYDLVAANAYWVLENNTLRTVNTSYNGEYCDPIKLARNVINPEKKEVFFPGVWSKLFKNSFIREHSLAYDQTLITVSDTLFFFEYLSKCRKIFCINKPLYHYVIRKHSNSRLGITPLQKWGHYTLYLSSLEVVCNRADMKSYVNDWQAEILTCLTTTLRSCNRGNPTISELRLTILDLLNADSVRRYLAKVNYPLLRRRKKILFLSYYYRLVSLIAFAIKSMGVLRSLRLTCIKILDPK
jgi:glycosyltransferase involved in cell wall biosynthesis